MKLPVKVGMLAALIPAFIVYFYSESVLRQGAISNIDSKKFNIDTVISELPGTIKDAISYKIHYGQLQDSIRNAKNPKEKAYALSNMADFIKEPEKRVELYEQVLTLYPNIPEAARAYNFFLLNPETKTKISVVQYHNYLKRFSEFDQYYIWTIGLAKLRELGSGEKVIFEFLLPLLNRKPKFRDYSGLYRRIGELASKLQHKEAYRKAVKYEEICLDLPLLDTIYMEELEKKKQAGSDAKNNKKGK